MSSKYTLVQHSGYGGGNGDPTWQRGLEQVSLSDSDLKRVEKAGGLVFDNYSEADRAIESISYEYTRKPDAPSGFQLVPQAEGTFSGTEVKGLKVYLPTPSEVERVVSLGEYVEPDEDDEQEGLG